MKRIYQKTRSWLVLSLFAAGACQGAPADVVDDCDTNLQIPPSVSTDILFVIDNSISMREEQEKVIDELSTFAYALASGPVQNDFQIGVITTGISEHFHFCDSDELHLRRFPDESGLLQQGKDIDGQVIDPQSPKILTSSTPDFLDAVAALLFQGVAGPGQEMGLEAMRLALTPPLIARALDGDPPGNAGFLRTRSRLLVVIVSDEDDCSDPTATAVVAEPACGPTCDSDDECPDAKMVCLPDFQGVRRCQLNACETVENRLLLEPVSRYVDFLQSLTDGTSQPRPREVFLAVIGAVDPDDPTQEKRCDRGGTEAHGSAQRYLEAVQAMGDNGFIDSICRDDFGAALQSIAELVNAPHVLELEKSPPDGRLLLVEITRNDGSEVLCRYGEGFEFDPPANDAPGRVTLIGDCRLRHGDEIQIKQYCAG